MRNFLIVKTIILLYFTSIAQAEVSSCSTILAGHNIELQTIRQVLFRDARENNLDIINFPHIVRGPSGPYRVTTSRFGDSAILEYVSEFGPDLYEAFDRRDKGFVISPSLISVHKKAIEHFAYQRALSIFLSAIAENESMIESRAYIRTIELLHKHREIDSFDSLLEVLGSEVPPVHNIFLVLKRKSLLKWIATIESYRQIENQGLLEEVLRIEQDGIGGGILMVGHKPGISYERWVLPDHDNNVYIASMQPYRLYKMVNGELQPVSHLAVSIDFWLTADADY